MLWKIPGRTGLIFGLIIVVSGCSNAAEPDSDAEPGAPVFTSLPAANADHNREYVYTIEAVGDDGAPVDVSVPVHPDWLSFDPESTKLSGTAGWDNIDMYPISILATDGELSTRQNFTLTVSRGEIVCDQAFGDPSDSDYALPYPVGLTFGMIQSYCPPNPAWGHHDWFAYDFDMAIGDTVLASRAGRVISVLEDNQDNRNGADCSGGKENYIFILHDDGTVMQYVHLTLDGALVDAGAFVSRGDPIGISGNTGCSSGPHLHVALFRNRTNFDRQSTLPFNYRNASGSLDANQGLQTGGRYEAVPY